MQLLEKDTDDEEERDAQDVASRCGRAFSLKTTYEKNVLINYELLLIDYTLID